MCGVIGIAIAPSRRNFVTECRRREALEALRHRGPDGQGEYIDEKVWMAHRRLSILDLSDAGSQPMQSADGRFVISYNGEVYNFRELAAKNNLDNLRSSSDTEVVLELFAKFGIASLEKLNGMFAFSIYDRQTRKIWLVRDRLGIKPIYFRIRPRELIFGSEIKGIAALLDESLVCNYSALHEWLYFGNTLGGRTLYQNITQLLPAHYLELDLSSFEVVIREYWSLKMQSEIPFTTNVSKQDTINETRGLLERAVQRQLVSDVPVGVFLSGGVDSSAVAAFASRHYEGQLATYSVGFDFSPEHNELPMAKRVADLYRTDHHELRISGGDVADLVEKMVVAHDMPFSDAANIPLYLMAAEIGAQTKVVLQGDGGDELFGGYRRYTTLKYYGVFHSVAKILQYIHAVTPKSPLYHRIQRYLHAFAAQDLATTMALLQTAEDRDSKPLELFSSSLAELIGEEADAFARFRELQSLFGHQDIANQMSFIDISIVLPDTYLEKVDRSTMAASVEVRVPFLDHDLVDYTVRLTGKRKIPFGKKKWLLKAALAGLVPNEILYGPKIGFGVPFGNWLQTSLKPLFFDHLASFDRKQPGILNVEHIEHLFCRTSDGKENHSHLLWKILNFLVWTKTSNIEFSEQSVN